MKITRMYEKTLKTLFAQFPAVMVAGARQVYKTAHTVEKYKCLLCCITNDY